MKKPSAPLIMSLVLAAIISGCGSAPTTVWEPTPEPTLPPPATLTAAPEDTPIAVSTATPEPVSTYSELAFGIAVQLPPDWLPQDGYERRYAGSDGFFQLSAISGEGLTIDEVTDNEAQHKLQPYGSAPTIESLLVQGREARLILPSADQPAQMEGQAGLVIKALQPVEIWGFGYNYLILWADQEHIRDIAATVQLSVPRPKAIQAALWQLSLQFQTTPSEVELMRWERVDWPNGCLGVPVRGMCTAAIVPGYRIMVEMDGDEYEYRSDEEGIRVLLAAGPDHGIEEPVLTWEGDEEGECQSLMLATDGRAAIGPCDAPLIALPLPEEPGRAEQWADLQSRFAAFEAQTDWGRVVFTGQGDETATPAWERAIAAWARLVWAELQLGQSGASWATALRWHEKLADSPGHCRFLVVDVYGMAFASTALCDGGAAVDLGHGWLTSEELERLDAWFYGWSGLSWPDLYFFGTGSQAMSESELTELAIWSEAVYDRLVKS